MRCDGPGPDGHHKVSCPRCPTLTGKFYRKRGRKMESDCWSASANNINGRLPSVQNLMRFLPLSLPESRDASTTFFVPVESPSSSLERYRFAPLAITPLKTFRPISEIKLRQQDSSMFVSPKRLSNLLVFGRTVTNGTCQSKSPAVGIGITCIWSSLSIGVIAFATCSFWQLYLKLAKQSHWIEAIGSRASLLCLITFT